MWQPPGLVATPATVQAVEAVAANIMLLVHAVKCGACTCVPNLGNSESSGIHDMPLCLPPTLVFLCGRNLLVYQKASLVATRDFWRLLTRDKVPLERLGHSFTRMEEMESKAEATYKMVLDRYPSNAKLLRSYGKFLESIKVGLWSPNCLADKFSLCPLWCAS